MKTIEETPRLLSMYQRIQRLEDTKTVSDVKSLLKTPLFSQDERNYLCSKLLDQLYFGIETKKVHDWVAWICGAGYFEACMFFLKRKANVNTLGTGLHLAAGEGHLEVVRLLLDYGVNVHSERDAALLHASIGGHVDVVSFLLDRGADVHAGNGQALKHARKFNHSLVIEILLKRGADDHNMYRNESDGIAHKLFVELNVVSGRPYQNMIGKRADDSDDIMFDFFEGMNCI